VSDNWLQGPSDGNAMGTSNEQYFFDNVGNLQSVKHSGSDPTQPGWTRTYNYAEKSLLEPASKFNNQVSSTSVGGVTDQYSYTGNAGLTGNMTSMPHLSLMQYDFRDQLQATATQRVNSGTPETTWYSYDTGGKRVRKLTVNAAAAGAKPIPKAERIYLGPFEVYREFAVDGTTVTLQRETLSIMNGPQRIALIETRSIGTDKYPAQQIRFQYTNHIGSASLELDDQAQILTYEEFYPFGSSSYQATGSQSEVPKRYRYTGKELDGENGFYYHGARYCAPWLGRWINCDPGGTDTSGPNLYAYANGNPVIYNDLSGMEAKKHKPSYHSTYSKPDKKVALAAPAVPPLGPSKLDVLINELIAILKKDIANKGKALAEAKASIAKAAIILKEALNNPLALSTPTTINGS
jgi:RHS repeat-associated protein